MKNWIALLMGFAMTAFYSISSAETQDFTCRSTYYSPYEIESHDQYDHDLYAPVNTDNLKKFGAYVSSFDSEDDDNGDGDSDYLGVPHWVSYELKSVDKHSVSGRPKWYEDKALSFLWEGRDGIDKKGLEYSYHGDAEIWNRGHLAMFDHAKRVSKEAACNTFHFWNAVPQDAKMNQEGGAWRKLEDLTTEWVKESERIWIISGPVFKENFSIGYIGDKGEVPIAVPHALFKVIVRNQSSASGAKPKRDDEIEAIGFLFPQHYEIKNNGNPMPEGKPSQRKLCDKGPTEVNLADCIVPISQIEELNRAEFLSKCKE